MNKITDFINRVSAREEQKKVAVSTSAFILPFHSQTEYKENQVCKHEKRIFSAKKNFISGNVFAEEDWYALDVDTGEIGPQGAEGPPGPAGPAGPAGQSVRGEVGPEGLPGPMGPKGEAGSTGPQGQPGAAAEKGETGPAGPAGIQGEKGPQGPPGEKGSIGQPGPQGEKGSVGPAGATGPQGIAGEKGFGGVPGTTGPTGPAGATGAKGATGVTGPQGPAGPKGETGPAGSGTNFKAEALGVVSTSSVVFNVSEGRRLFTATISAAESTITFINAPSPPEYAEVTCILTQGTGGNKKFTFPGISWVEPQPTWGTAAGAKAYVSILLYNNEIIGIGL